MFPHHREGPLVADTVAAPPATSKAQNRWFVAMLALTGILAPVALVGPLVALATPLRTARHEMRTLWILAVALIVILWGAALFASSELWPDWLILDPEENASA